MIKKYSLFYSYHTLGDMLIISIIDAPITSVDNRNMVELCYNKDRLVTIRLKGISKIMKIHTSGLIPLPGVAFIDVVNSILTKELAPNLSYKNRSDFTIGEVVEGGVNIKDSIIKLDVSNLKLNDKVVLANKDTRLATGKWTKDYHICTFKDLHINDSDDIFIIDEDDVIIGNDFFKIGEN